jgi:hypothetical protein
MRIRVQKPLDLTYEEKCFIRNNHHCLTVDKMRKVINRGTKKIYEFMEAEGLQEFKIYNTGKKKTVETPFFNVHARENWMV